MNTYARTYPVATQQLKDGRVDSVEGQMLAGELLSILPDCGLIGEQDRARRTFGLLLCWLSTAIAGRIMK